MAAFCPSNVANFMEGEDQWTHDEQCDADETSVAALKAPAGMEAFLQSFCPERDVLAEERRAEESAHIALYQTVLHEQLVSAY